MYLSIHFVLACLICVSLALDRIVVKPLDDDDTSILQANEQIKQMDRKTSVKPRRKRRKFRRPFKESTLIGNATAKFGVSEVDDEYSQRINSFASAIKDTNSFLRFLKQEESKHLGNYVRRRDFNFNNHTLTTRFLQAPTNVGDNNSVVLLPKESTGRELRTNRTYEQVLMRPSPLLSPPSFSGTEATTERRAVGGEDEPRIRAPNRGLVPPLPTENEVFYNQGLYTTTVASTRKAKKLDQGPYTTTTSQPGSRQKEPAAEPVERRAPLPVKKRNKQPKNKMPQKYLKTSDDEFGEIQLSVAETRYYKKRPLLVLPRMAHRYDAQQVIPGVAGRDYTVYDRPPVSGYACSKLDRGYHADTTTGCQVFYICTGDGRGEPMLCPNGTLFNQDVLVCDWWFNVNCR